MEGSVCSGPEFNWSDVDGALRVQQAGKNLWPFTCSMASFNGLNLSSTGNGLWTAPHGVWRYIDTQGFDLPGPVSLSGSSTYLPTTTPYTVKNPSRCSNMAVFWWFQTFVKVVLVPNSVAIHYSSLGVGAPSATPAERATKWNPSNAANNHTWYDMRSDVNYLVSGAMIPPLGSQTFYPTIKIAGAATPNPVTVLGWGSTTMYMGILIDPTQAGSAT